MAARSDHSRALPDGSASTSSTDLPAWAKMCASQTAEVVLPVPGLRLSKATLRAGINAVLQCLRHYGRRCGACDPRNRAAQTAPGGGKWSFPQGFGYYPAVRALGAAAYPQAKAAPGHVP